MPRSRRAPPLPPNDRRDAIVDAVAPLLISRGAAVTTREMAEAAGVAEGTLFSVFEDKRALVLAAIRHRLDPLPTRAAIAAAEAPGDLAATLTAVADRLLPRLDEVRALAAVLHGLPPAPKRDGRLGAAVLETWHAAVHEGIATLLRPHEAYLRLPAERAAAVFAALLFASRPLYGPPRPTLATFELVDVFLHGAVADRANGAT
ncbi:MAG: TetR/AcrR family transcriptional regulator [Trueperaceae bacterium]